MMNLTQRQQSIIDFIISNKQVSISEIKTSLLEDVSMPTLNRELALLVKQRYLQRTGKGRAIKYSISAFYQLFAPINETTYFDQEPDTRLVSTHANLNLLDTFKDVEIFTPKEKELLETLRQEYQSNVASISPTLYKKELERLTIELSWKSAQIEGNTYSLLETERLFIEKEVAKDKSKEEALMLLNHKKALDYMLQYKSLGGKINLRTIEEIHSLLIKDLGVGRNIRSRAVGITGTAYKPLDNEFQIREYIEQMCHVINAKTDGFEKAILAIVLISYIQPFEDGNKRTGRMIGNALLINHEACPLSYRSVTPLDYKKAMLLFYEQNNLSMFKQLFIEQNIFGVKNYFR